MPPLLAGLDSFHSILQLSGIFPCNDPAVQIFQQLLQNLHRLPAKVIPGYQTIYASTVLSLDTVMEPAFSMAVGIDHLLRSVFLRHIRKAAAFFHDADRRIVQEHYDLTTSMYISRPINRNDKSDLQYRFFLSIHRFGHRYHHNAYGQNHDAAGKAYAHPLPR